MRAIVTFVIPVRHPQNAKDWPLLKANLAQTLRSISAQTHPGWRAVVVANHGVDLPPLGPGVEVVRVGFPPNPNHDRTGVDEALFLEVFRLDKGRRVLAGMLHTRDTGYYMVVDDDDLVSRNIVAFAANHSAANGWFVKRGYVWSAGGRALFSHDDFYNICGTSLIIRSDLYGLPARFEDASEAYIKAMLGSHRKIAPILAARGAALAELPFRGAIYRVGHAGSHSQSSAVMRAYVFNQETLRQPRRLAENLSKLRWLNASVRAEFFG